MALQPRASGELIVKLAKHLKVNGSGVDKLCRAVLEGLKSKEIDVENFSQHEFHPKPEDPKCLNWLFLIDTLNFCFWTPGNATKWRVEGQTGYFALCAAINRARKAGEDITNPEYYVKLDVEDLERILRCDDGETKAPLIQERVKCLKEVGQTLLEKYGGNFENCVKQSGKSAEKLLQMIVEDFPCFRDEASYEGQRVAIYKRAQILIGDIWACFRGEGIGEFPDIGKITMFADYRVPQVLVHFGALEYNEDLMKRLKSDEILENGSEAEVEIRGASIFIVEELKDKVLAEIREKKLEISTKNVNSVLLDHFLWDYRRRHAAELEYIPFHKTYSVFY
ncbi:queuosine 5'-phosphate N-glycosylase/hydrolase [Phlebotomus argentipes]|uniref:queuosine 5'-phosphate N-glycosylase/hydrolase n=1 Tax=Phlebotomus argentipes TaxID=94469 RepID=UPI0028936E6E|nr:queuosine 5'-phosphate N-glycosylase/hydrolase [Phlebotomus argentipes]